MYVCLTLSAGFVISCSDFTQDHGEVRLMLKIFAYVMQYFKQTTFFQGSDKSRLLNCLEINKEGNKVL